MFNVDVISKKEFIFVSPEMWNFLKKRLTKTAIITEQKYNVVAYHKPSSKESVSTEMYLYFDGVVGLAWSDHPWSYACGNVATGRAYHAGQVVVSCAVPVTNVSRMFSQEGWTLKFKLRRGVGQTAHTRNNPHVKCTGIYWA